MNESSSTVGNMGAFRMLEREEAIPPLTRNRPRLMRDWRHGWFNEEAKGGDARFARASMRQSVEIERVLYLGLRSVLRTDTSRSIPGFNMARFQR
jgi:hypothetical protein